jgi:16S rRNA (guanine(1405)-N(7))-methyltransferase
MVNHEDQLDQLIASVQSAEKYKKISPDLVQDIGRMELAKRPNLKEAIKATRSKLHQIGSAFQEKSIPYTKWIEELNHLPPQVNTPETLSFIKSCLPAHSSTCERIPIVEKFFNETLASIAPVTSILDLACGLNPLSVPWMPISRDCTYSGVDIYVDMVDFVNRFLNHFSIKSNIQVADLTKEIPQEKAQVAFLLKTIPCLEQLDKTAGRRLLHGLQTQNILVSFPVRSLGGHSKGMVSNYEAHFNDLIEGMDWKITRYQYSDELAFLIQK